MRDVKYRDGKWKDMMFYFTKYNNLQSLHGWKEMEEERHLVGLCDKGFMIVNEYLSYELGKVVHLESVYIKKEFRGNKLGTNWVKSLMSVCDKNYYPIYLTETPIDYDLRVINNLKRDIRNRPSIENTSELEKCFYNNIIDCVNQFNESGCDETYPNNHLLKHTDKLVKWYKDLGFIIDKKITDKVFKDEATRKELWYNKKHLFCDTDMIWYGGNND
jgi:hypothetical protein